MPQPTDATHRACWAVSTPSPMTSLCVAQLIPMIADTRAAPPSPSPSLLVSRPWRNDRSILTMSMGKRLR